MKIENKKKTHVFLVQILQKINCLYQCKITEVKIKDILITLNQIFEKIFGSMKVRFKQKKWKMSSEKFEKLDNHNFKNTDLTLKYVQVRR